MGGLKKPRGLFRVDARDALLKGGASGEAAVVPGHSAASPLIDYVSGNVPDSEMPPRAQRGRFPALSPGDVALLRTWIDQGAEWPKDAVLSAPRSSNRGDASRSRRNFSGSRDPGWLRSRPAAPGSPRGALAGRRRENAGGAGAGRAQRERYRARPPSEGASP
jgi:Planctomycete cytochrome C